MLHAKRGPEAILGKEGESEKAAELDLFSKEN